MIQKDCSLPCVKTMNRKY